MAELKERTEIAAQSKRDVPSILKEIEALATISNEVAMSCFYVIFDKRDNKPFVGISVRLAELIASCWGNIEAGARVTKNNGMTLTVEGFVHDFEKNSMFTVEVQRNISKLSPEMAIQANNAASSIAFRNAVFKAVPSALFSATAKRIKSYITDNAGDETLSEVVKYFLDKGIQAEDFKGIIKDDITTPDGLFLLIGLRNAIEEGDITLEEAFGMELKVKPKRSSRYVAISEEVEEEPTADAPKTSKDMIKEGLSTLKTYEIPEEEIVEEVKAKPKKKRGRGRPRKNGK